MQPPLTTHVFMRAPIFIIGYPRSGTSFVGKLVGEFTGYPSHGESHLVPLLQNIIHQINLYTERTDFTGAELVKELDSEALKAYNYDFFRQFYFRSYGSEQFIDKTPGPTACSGWGVIKQVFPNACFVACVRSPAEVYQSAVQKFGTRDGEHGKVDAISLAEGWAGSMNSIDNLSKSPYADDLHIVSQLQLRSDPSAVVNNLFRFLRIPTSSVERGIEFCSASRDDMLTDTFHRNAYKTLEELNLPRALAEKFRDICSDQSRRWGILL